MNDIFTSVAWSVKGKQFVAGRPDGTMEQYTPDGTKKATIPPPESIKASGSYRATTINWMENDAFLVTYGPAEDGADHQHFLVQRQPKSDPPAFSYSLFDFILSPWGMMERKGDYRHLAHVKDWGDDLKHLVFLSSPPSADIAVIYSGAAQPETPAAAWNIAMLDERARPAVPMNSNNKDTTCFGLEVDLTNSKPIKQDDEGGVPQPDLPPVPRLMELNSEGVIITYNILNSKTPSYAGMVKPADITTAPAESAASRDPASKSATAATEPVKSKLGASAFGSPSPTTLGEAKPAFGFGQTKLPALGSMASPGATFGSQPKAPAFGSTGSSSFGSSAFGQKPAFGSPALTPAASTTSDAVAQDTAKDSSKSNESESKPSAFGSGQATPSFGFGGFGKTTDASSASAFGASTFGQTSKPADGAVAPPNRLGSSAFGGASATSSGDTKPTFGFGQTKLPSFGSPATPATPSTPGQGSTFGSSTFGKPAAFGSSTAATSSTASSGQVTGSAFGSTAFGKPSAFGSSSSSTSGAFGSSAFGKSPAASTTTPSASPQGAANAFGASQGAGTSAFGSSAFGKSSAFGSTSPSSTPSKPPTSGMFGSSAFGTKPDTAATGTSVTPSPTSGFGNAFGAFAPKKPSPLAGGTTDAAGKEEKSAFSFSGFGLEASGTKDSVFDTTNPVEDEAQEDEEPEDEDVLSDPESDAAQEPEISIEELSSEEGEPEVVEQASEQGSVDEESENEQVEEHDEDDEERDEEEDDSGHDEGQVTENQDEATAVDLQDKASELDLQDQEASPSESEPDVESDSDPEPPQESEKKADARLPLFGQPSVQANTTPAKTPSFSFSATNTTQSTANEHDTDAKPPASGQQVASRSPVASSTTKDVPPSGPAKTIPPPFSFSSSSQKPSPTFSLSQPSGKPLASTASVPPEEPEVKNDTEDLSAPQMVAHPAPALEWDPEPETPPLPHVQNASLNDTPVRPTGRPAPKPSAASYELTGLSAQFGLIYRELENQLRGLELQAEESAAYHAALSHPPTEIPSRGDIPLAEFWYFGCLETLAQYTRDIASESRHAKEENRPLNEEVAGLVKTLHMGKLVSRLALNLQDLADAPSALGKIVQEKAEDCARYVRALTDPSLRRTLNQQGLTDSQRSQRSELRKHVERVRDAIAQAEQSLGWMTMRVEREKEMNDGLREAGGKDDETDNVESITKELERVGISLQDRQTQLDMLSEKLDGLMIQTSARASRQSSHRRQTAGSSRRRSGVPGTGTDSAVSVQPNEVSIQMASQAMNAELDGDLLLKAVRDNRSERDGMVRRAAAKSTSDQSQGGSTGEPGQAVRQRVLVRQKNRESSHNPHVAASTQSTLKTATESNSLSSANSKPSAPPSLLSFGGQPQSSPSPAASGMKPFDFGLTPSTSGLKSSGSGGAGSHRPLNKHQREKAEGAGASTAKKVGFGVGNSPGGGFV